MKEFSFLGGVSL